MAAPLEKVVCIVNRHIFSCLRRYGADTIKIRSPVLCNSFKLQGASYSTEAHETEERDPFPLFARRDIQKMLRRMTGYSVEKVTAPRPTPLSKPRYRLMDDAELKELERRANHRMKRSLHMPPYMNVHKPIDVLLSRDPELEGLNESKLVCTDITFGVPDNTRLIVIRDHDGTLRKASWDERDRINHVYNPREGRMMMLPKMFEDEFFERLLKKKKYNYILDRACVQFEPNHEDYIRVTHRTYQCIDSNHDYDDLRSTRHFGPMAFHLVWNKQMDYLLIDMMQRDLVDDALELINLYCSSHPETDTARHFAQSESETPTIELVKVYCEKESKHKGQLELAIQGLDTNMAASQS